MPNEAGHLRHGSGVTCFPPASGMRRHDLTTGTLLIFIHLAFSSEVISTSLARAYAILDLTLFSIPYFPRFSLLFRGRHSYDVQWLKGSVQGELLHTSSITQMTMEYMCTPRAGRGDCR